MENGWMDGLFLIAKHGSVLPGCFSGFKRMHDLDDNLGTLPALHCLRSAF